VKRIVAILGATGSIGQSTLDVISRHPDRFEVFALSANSRVQELVELCRRFVPRLACIADAGLYSTLRTKIAEYGLPTQVVAGARGLEDIAAHPDVTHVVAAVVGAAGLRSTIAAARSGKTILLANKEALVMAGDVFMQAVRSGGATLLPVDSEHNAVFQCLPASSVSGIAKSGVKRIILTASGGPFRTRSIASLRDVTPDQACAHPNWSMGRKISVDSATMMNKGLELIEAHWLFSASADQLDVLIHPQSIVHSMVEYADGSVLAQMGNPDMRTPIANALAYPERIESGVLPLDLASIGSLTFEAADDSRFPAIGLALQALRQGNAASAVLNAANEVAVGAFLESRLPFTEITRVIRMVLDEVPLDHAGTLEDVVHADQIARQCAASLISAGKW
jgi:1-deoxy-D-xylulose-5-phosphate reductoisomerase